MQSRKIGSTRVLIPSLFPLYVDFQGQKGESCCPGKELRWEDKVWRHRQKMHQEHR